MYTMISGESKVLPLKIGGDYSAESIEIEFRTNGKPKAVFSTITDRGFQPVESITYDPTVSEKYPNGFTLVTLYIQSELTNTFVEGNYEVRFRAANSITQGFTVFVTKAILRDAFAVIK